MKGSNRADGIRFVPDELRLLWDESFTPARLGGLASLRGLYYQYLYSLALARELLQPDPIYEAYASEWIEDFFAWGRNSIGNLEHVLLVQVKTALNHCYLTGGNTHRVFATFARGIEALSPHLNPQTIVHCRLVYNPQRNHDCHLNGCVSRLQKRSSYRAAIAKIATFLPGRRVEDVFEFESFLPIPITKVRILEQLSFLDDLHPGFTDLLRNERDLTTFIRSIYGLITPLYVPRVDFTERSDELHLDGLHRSKIHARDDIVQAIETVATSRRRLELRSHRRIHEFCKKEALRDYKGATPTKEVFLRPEARGIMFTAETEAQAALAIVHILSDETTSIFFQANRFAVLKVGNSLRLEVASTDAVPISEYLRKPQTGHLERVKLLISFTKAVVDWSSKGVIISDFRADNPEYENLYLARPDSHFTMADLSVLSLCSDANRLLAEEWLAGPLLAKAFRYLYYGKVQRRKIENTRFYRAAWNDNVVRDLAKWLDAVPFIRTQDVLEIVQNLFRDEIDGWPFIFSHMDDQFVFDIVDLGYKYAADVLGKSRLTDATLSEDRGHQLYRLLYTSWRNAQLGSFEKAPNILTLYRYTEYETRRWASARDRDRGRHKAISLVPGKERERIYAVFCEDQYLNKVCFNVFGISHQEYKDWLEGEKYRARNIPQILLPPVLERERSLFLYRRGKLDALRERDFSFEFIKPKGSDIAATERSLLVQKGNELVERLETLGYRAKTMRTLSARCRDTAGKRARLPVSGIRRSGEKVLLDVILPKSAEQIPERGTFNLTDAGTESVSRFEDSVFRELELSLSTIETVGPELAAGRAWNWLEPIFGRDRPNRAANKLTGSLPDNFKPNNEVVEEVVGSILEPRADSNWRIITGAAGTGKTHVTASITYHYLERTQSQEFPPRRVLVVSAAHYGVDNFVRVFLSVCGQKYIPYRFVTNSRVLALKDIGVIDSKLYEFSQNHYDTLQSELPRPQNASQFARPFETYQKKLEAQLQEINQLTTSRKSSMLFLPSHQQWRLAYTNGAKWLSDYELNRRRAYLNTRLEQVALYEERNDPQISTTNRSPFTGSKLYALFGSEVVATTLDGFDRLPDMSFDLIVVEEASQVGLLKLLKTLTKVARARDTLLPPPKIILSGDQRQLPPFLELTPPDANYKGVDKEILSELKPAQREEVSQYANFETAFETACRRHPNRVFPLTTQYRMHPEIARFVNKLFYGDQDWIVSRKPKGLGVVWIDTSALLGTNETEKGGTSRFNTNEIRVVSNLVRNLIPRQAEHHEEILVISPYLAQVSKLEDALKELPGVKVRTIDGCQGIEANIVILSFVSLSFAPGNDFVVNPKRLNVAISRARDSLFLVGKFHEALSSLQRLSDQREYSHVARLVASFDAGGWLSNKRRPARLITN